MQVAQRLYERGYITYMRTDSTTLSETAISAARDQARALYGAEYGPARPAGVQQQGEERAGGARGDPARRRSFRTPSQVAGELAGDERRLYELIWQRTVASQMNDATGTTARARIDGRTADRVAGVLRGRNAPRPSWRRARSSPIPGSCAVYREDEDDDGWSERRTTEDVRLPRLVAGASVDCDGLEVEEHATKPPARYTEASLVRRLEELGVGRPSTYASIIGTIQDRGYVWKKGTALVPSFTAFAVVGLLEQHFAEPRRLRVHRRDGGRPRRDRLGQPRSRSHGSSASTSASTVRGPRTPPETPGRRSRWSVPTA